MQIVIILKIKNNPEDILFAGRLKLITKFDGSLLIRLL